MQNQVLGAMMAILFALSGWALLSINTLQQEMAAISTGHVTLQTVHELQRQVDRLEILLERESGVK